MGCREATAPPARARLLPDTRGRIESVVLSLASGRRAALRNADIVSRLVDALPPDTRVRILTNDRAAFDVRQPAAPLRRRDVEFLEVPPDHDLTIWPQDPFLVLETQAGGTRLLRAHGFERADDRVMAEAIAGSAGWSVGDSALEFEGGNVVADTRRIFVGANTIRRNAIAADVAEAEIAARFEASLGAPVVVVGPVPQPLAHLDMYLTPLGGDRVLLADPGAGAAIAERLLEASPESVARFEETVSAWFFADPAVATLPGRDAPIEAPDLSGATRRAARDSARLAPLFDSLADALRARGLDVHRVPILLDDPARPPASDRARDESSERPFAAPLDFPILTYNNVIQEEREGSRSVWLPHYGLAPLDRAAADAWRALGYRVVPIEGYATSALYGGALRCSAKVTERSR
ncbi:MAG: hypothetical protein H6748_21280 [Spirochaetaceae bacterium]|nr:hypothetical protein [Myxococcales bacterium]MCB9726593.1 hypothetical protein [Spirochaetaceae bacterium]